MFSFCVDQVSRLEYKPDEDDRRWRVEHGDVRPKKQSSPAMLERHSAMPGQHSSRTESKPTTHFFGRTKKVSAPPSSQIEAVLAAAAHIREEERRRKRSAVHTSHTHTPHQNVQSHHLHPNYQALSTPSASSPHSTQKPNQQSTFHHPFSRSPLFQLHAPQQPSSQPQSRPNPPRKHSEGRRPVEAVAEKSQPKSKADALGAQLDAALEAVARRRREAIGSKVQVAKARGGKAECG